MISAFGQYIGPGVSNCCLVKCGESPGVWGIQEWLAQRMNEFESKETTNRSMVSIFGPPGANAVSVQKVGDSIVINFGEP